MEILWFPHAFVLDRLAKYSRGDRGSCTDRWCQFITEFYLYYSSLAWQYHTHICLPLDPRFNTAVHSGLDHDERRSGKCKRDAFNLHVSIWVHTFPTGLWCRRGNLYVFALT